MRVYLAGPMGLEPPYNFPAFDAAAHRLRAQGHEIVSPAELDREAGFDGAGPLPEGFTEQAMRRDIAAILTVDAVAVLAGWQASKGCAVEIAVARSVGRPVLDADTLQPVEPSGDSGQLAQLFGRAEELPAGTFITRDSGKREEWSTGSRRDTREGKGRFDLLPPVAIRRLAQLYERGAAKYGDRNWEKGQPLSRYLDSALRHLFDYLGGDRTEDHLAAVAWNALGHIETEARIEAGKLPETLREAS